MSILFSPFQFNKLQINNRFIFSACEDNLADDEGYVTDEMIRRYRRHAKGEVGLIISGQASVHALGRTRRCQLGVYRDDMIPGLKKLIDGVHQEGGKILLQLGHAGLQAGEAAIGRMPLGPSPSRNGMEMTEEQIQEAVAAFSAGASRAAEAGADGVQLHAAHGYLISEFLSPYFNHRTDHWGGSAEHQYRLLGCIVDKMKSTLPSGVPLLVKLNAHDHTPEEGVTPALAAWYAKKLAESPVDGIEISCGTSSRSSWNMCRGDVPVKEISSSFPENRRPGIKAKLQKLAGKYNLWEGYNLEAAGTIRPVMGNIPLFAVGGFRSIPFMEEALINGGTDCISLCRPLIKEPNLVKRIREGKSKAASCSNCNKCLAAIARDLPVKCYEKNFPG